jgi:hypothetical protein
MQSNTKYYEQSLSCVYEYTDTFFCFNITNFHHAAVTYVYTQEIHISVNNHAILDLNLGFIMMSTQEKSHNSVPVYITFNLAIT